MSAKIAQINTDTDTGSVTVTFTDGTEQAVTLKELPKAIVTQLALLGLGNKLRDSYAGYAAKYSDKATEMAQASVERVVGALKDGTWTVRSEGGSGPRMSIWVEAVARAFGIDLDDAANRYAQLDKEAKAAVRKDATVKRAKLQIESERAEAGEESGGNAANVLGI